MTKKVLFYARYSADLQHEVSIETQVELGKAMVARRGWSLIEVFRHMTASQILYEDDRLCKPTERARLQTNWSCAAVRCNTPFNVRRIPSFQFGNAC